MCRLRTELDTKEWEVDCANANVAAAIEERNAAQALAKQLKLASASSYGGKGATGWPQSKIEGCSSNRRRTKLQGMESAFKSLGILVLPQGIKMSFKLQDAEP